MYAEFDTCQYVEQIYYENWIKVTDLRTYLARLRRDNFSLQDAKVAALASLNAICISPPFSKTIRFPEHTTYIIDSVEPYLSNLMKIRQFLTTKTRQLEMGRGIVASDMGMSQDLQKAFQEAIKLLIDALNKSCNVINRERLEANIEWVLAENRLEPDDDLDRDRA